MGPALLPTQSLKPWPEQVIYSYLKNGEAMAATRTNPMPMASGAIMLNESLEGATHPRAEIPPASPPVYSAA